MTSRLQTILKSIVLFGFSVIVIAVFRYFSMLRPGAYGALYKEMIAGGIVLAICFLNYFILYPLFYTKRRFLFLCNINCSQHPCSNFSGGCTGLSANQRLP